MEKTLYLKSQIGIICSYVKLIFHILVFGLRASASIGDVQDFEILITVRIVLMLMKALCMWDFTKMWEPCSLPSPFLSALLEYVQNTSEYRMYFSSVQSIFPNDHLYKPW